MNKEAIKLWIEALRSGEYKQCQFALEKSSGNCCLGVACRVAYLKEGVSLVLDEVGRLSGGSLASQIYVKAWLSLPDCIQDNLIKMNDIKNCSFLEIADYLETLIKDMK